MYKMPAKRKKDASSAETVGSSSSAVPATEGKIDIEIDIGTVLFKKILANFIAGDEGRLRVTRQGLRFFEVDGSHICIQDTYLSADNLTSLSMVADSYLLRLPFGEMQEELKKDVYKGETFHIEYTKGSPLIVKQGKLIASFDEVEEDDAELPESSLDDLWNRMGEELIKSKKVNIFQFESSEMKNVIKLMTAMGNKQADSLEISVRDELVLFNYPKVLHSYPAKRNDLIQGLSPISKELRLILLKNLQQAGLKFTANYLKKITEGNAQPIGKDKDETKQYLIHTLKAGLSDFTIDFAKSAFSLQWMEDIANVIKATAIDFATFYTNWHSLLLIRVHIAPSSEIRFILAQRVSEDEGSSGSIEEALATEIREFLMGEKTKEQSSDKNRRSLSPNTLDFYLVNM